MKNKRWIFLGSGVLVMILLTTGYAVSGFKGQFHRFHGEGFMKEHVLSKMDYTMQELELSPDQQVRYSDIRTRMGSGLDTMMQRHKAMRDNLKAEWDRPEPDVKKLAGKIKQEISSMPDPLTSQIDYMVELYDILNTNQQKKLVAMLKDRFENRCRWSGDGPRGEF